MQGGKFLVQSSRVIRPWVTTRPLPRNTYKLTWNRHQLISVPCNDTQGLWQFPTTIRVTAPQGTLHEAFFDPVTDGTTVGADVSNGVLKPALFEAEGGTSTSIHGIEWEAQQVRMEFSPSAPPLGHHLDFIALDGSVALRLRVDDAAQMVDGDSTTLTWGCVLAAMAGG